jgi:hypothetical protein
MTRFATVDYWCKDKNRIPSPHQLVASQPPHVAVGKRVTSKVLTDATEECHPIEFRVVSRIGKPSVPTSRLTPP